MTSAAASISQSSYQQHNNLLGSTTPAINALRFSVEKNQKIDQLLNWRFKTPRAAVDAAWQGLGLGLRGNHDVYRNIALYFLEKDCKERKKVLNNDGWDIQGQQYNRERQQQSGQQYPSQYYSNSPQNTYQNNNQSKSQNQGNPICLRDWQLLLACFTRAHVFHQELSAHFRDEVFLGGENGQVNTSFWSEKDWDIQRLTTVANYFSLFNDGVVGLEVDQKSDKIIDPNDSKSQSVSSQYADSNAQANARLFKVLAERVARLPVSSSSSANGQTASGITTFGLSILAKAYGRLNLRPTIIRDLVAKQLPQMLVGVNQNGIPKYNPQDLAQFCLFFTDNADIWKDTESEEDTNKLENNDINESQSDNTTTNSNSKSNQDSDFKIQQDLPIKPLQSASLPPTRETESKLLDLLANACILNIPKFTADELGNVVLLFAQTRRHWRTLVIPCLRQVRRLDFSGLKNISNISTSSAVSSQLSPELLGSMVTQNQQYGTIGNGSESQQVQNFSDLDSDQQQQILNFNLQIQMQQQCQQIQSSSIPTMRRSSTYKNTSGCISPTTAMKFARAAVICRVSSLTFWNHLAKEIVKVCEYNNKSKWNKIQKLNSVNGDSESDTDSINQESEDSTVETNTDRTIIMDRETSMTLLKAFARCKVRCSQAAIALIQQLILTAQQSSKPLSFYESIAIVQIANKLELNITGPILDNIPRNFGNIKKDSLIGSEIEKLKMVYGISDAESECTMKQQQEVGEQWKTSVSSTISKQGLKTFTYLDPIQKQCQKLRPDDLDYIV